ncbi:MAG TPA: DUF4019 domain-containing protein [Casimicrobiaceae bacterium]
MRRGFLLALLALAIAAALPANAQDARATLVQDAARSWLALADNLDGPATFASAGDKFQRAMPVQRWTQALKDTHGPLGAMLTRTVVSTQFVDTVQGQPKGEYALILFRSSFAHRDFMQERLTLEKTAKGWQVIGYFPH